MKKKIFFLLPVFCLAFTACDTTTIDDTKGGDTTTSTESSSGTTITNDDIDTGYHYSISIDTTNVPEYLEVGGSGFDLAVSMESDEPGADLVPSESTLVIYSNDEDVCVIDGLSVIPVGRGTATIKVEWKHHSSVYDHVNVIVRNEGEQLLDYNYSLKIDRTDLPTEWYVGADSYTLNVTLETDDPEYVNVTEVSTDIVRVSVSNPDVIEVNGLTLTPIGEGTATVRVSLLTHSSVSDSVIFTVDERGVSNYTLNFTIMNGSSVTTCPEYGSLYLNYGKYDGSEWKGFKQLSENEDTYSITFASIGVTEYAYKIVFVYDGDEPDYSYQLTSADQIFTIPETASDGGSLDITLVIDYDLATKFPSHDEVYENYTLRFNVVKDGYSQKTNYGMSLYITGTFNNSSPAYYWGTFGKLEYEDITVDDNMQYRYSITFDSIYPGDYEYKLELCVDGQPGYTDYVTSANQTLTVDKSKAEDNIQDFEVTSDNYFAFIWS
ncbi:MAG: hypothetical protein LUC31_00925 [Coprobacillus sp.]|nr:hypothetical protein [Coprobacillus sp.]